MEALNNSSLKLYSLSLILISLGTGKLSDNNSVKLTKLFSVPSINNEIPVLLKTLIVVSFFILLLSNQFSNTWDIISSSSGNLLLFVLFLFKFDYM